MARGRSSTCSLTTAGGSWRFARIERGQRRVDVIEFVQLATVIGFW